MKRERRGRGIGRLARPEQLVEDVDDELAFHLEGRVNELVTEGWALEDARAEAARQFGDLARYRAECHAIARDRMVRERRGETMGHLRQDVRFALRSFRRSPGFASVAVITLALGIGATTAVFTVAKNVLFDPLPFEDPDALVMVFEQNLSQNVPRDLPSPPNYVDWAEQNRSFTGLAALNDGSVTLSGLDEPSVIQVSYVTPNTFTTLGVAAQYGRTLAADDPALPGGEDVTEATVAVISDRIWRERFGGDQAVIGRTIRLNDVPVEVVGVMPHTFDVPRADIDIWLPVDYALSNTRRQTRYLRVFGRLAPGSTAVQAKADLDRVQATIAEIDPAANEGWTVDVVPVREEVVGGSTRAILGVLLGAVGFVLLIACANVANLLLGRSTAREREISVRTALGASRGRVMRQLLTESVVLGLMGGIAGVALAFLGVEALLRLEPAGLPRLQEVSVDSGSLLFATVAALLTAALFGLAPAVHSARRSVAESLKGSTSVGGATPERARSALVIIEVAVSLVLLVGAGLLTRSLLELRTIDPGFESDGVTIARVNLGDQTYPTDGDRLLYFDEMLRRLRAVPGVSEAGVTSVLPMDPAGIDFDLPYEAEGNPVASRSELTQTSYRIASEGYFEALGMELLRGRTFNALDRPEASRVLIINEAFASQLWPDEEAVGKTITIYYGPPTPWEVVGVVEDTRHRGLAAPAPAQMYVPMSQAQTLFGYMHFAVKTTGDVGTVRAIREVGAEVDPRYPLYEVGSMDDVMAATTEEDRLVTTLLAAFALLALALAAVGIHGVVSYQVALRTREIGLRMALGADRSQVVGSVIRRAWTLAGAGVVLGLLGAAATTRVVQSFLYEVSPLDPLTFASVAATLMVVAFMAAMVPAVRAATTDPMGTLRNN